MSEQRVCGLCGQTFIGFCNHGTAWKPTEQTVNTGTAAGTYLNLYQSLIQNGVGAFKREGTFTSIPTPTSPILKRFVCFKCKLVFEQLDSPVINYCKECGNTQVEATLQPLGYYDVQMTASEIMSSRKLASLYGDSILQPVYTDPKCALCGASPSAKELAAELPGWLCCDPLPIMKPRRIISA